MSSFINSGAGIVPPIWFVLALKLNSENYFIIVKLAIILGVVWYSYYERMNCLCVYRRLLTNRLHGKATELCLANSLNNSVTTTKYINSFHGMRMSFYHVVLVKFYCDVINRSRLQLICTSINTFFCKLCTFLAEQRRRRRKTNDGQKVAR